MTLFQDYVDWLDIRVDPESILRREYLADEIDVFQFEEELEQVLRGDPPARFGMGTKGTWC